MPCNNQSWKEICVSVGFYDLEKEKSLFTDHPSSTPSIFLLIYIFESQKNRKTWETENIALPRLSMERYWPQFPVVHLIHTQNLVSYT